MVHVTPPTKSGYGKVTFLLTDIKDGFSGSGGYVAGFFYTLDMTNAVNSNKRDMLYVDTSPGLGNESSLFSTMAHELQHLINFSNTQLLGGSAVDLWINEGLSTAAEYVYGGDPSFRVSYYNDNVYGGGSIAYGNNFFVWNGSWDNDVLADYSTAYLFFQWLRLHASNGAGIYGDIMNNLRSGLRDYRAIVRAAKSRMNIPGLSSGSSDTVWEPVIRSWYLANIMDSPSGIYGYKNQIGTITKGVEPYLAGLVWPSNPGSIPFFPGEGMASAITSSPYTPPGGGGANIKYAGIAASGAIDTSPPYTGKYLLTFNASSAISGSAETGYLASTAPAVPDGAPESSGESPLFSRTGRRISPAPKIYPVDAWIILEQNKGDSDE
jgi:hypothetical protein